MGARCFPGIPELTNQTAIDMLQPGDVLVVNLFGKKVNGTIVGDNLFYYVMKATHGQANPQLVREVLKKELA